MTDTVASTPSDVLVVDEADSIPTAQMHRLASLGGNGGATTRVFMCRPPSVHRFNCPAADVVELEGFSIADARNYLLERANSIGRPDLFTPDAMDVVIHRTGGSCRSLRSIASLAFSTAASEGERQISRAHIAEGLESQMISVAVCALTTLAFLPDPHDYRKNLSNEGNVTVVVDRFLVGDKHMYHGDPPTEPEGFLSTFPAIVTALLGYWTGLFIQRRGVNYLSLIHI